METPYDTPVGQDSAAETPYDTPVGQDSAAETPYDARLRSRACTRERMDFRAQRYRDRLRADGRSFAIRTARATRAILDGYVDGRRGQLRPPRLRVLWGRIVLVVATGAALGVFLARTLAR